MSEFIREVGDYILNLLRHGRKEVRSAEAATWRCSVKKVFLEILKNSQ